MQKSRVLLSRDVAASFPKKLLYNKLNEFDVTLLTYKVF